MFVVLKVYIPFKEQFKDVMLSGKKIKTTRSKRYGSPGDWFEIFGAKFQIESVEKKQLGRIAMWDYEDEGFDTMVEFIECWNEIHPRVGFDKNKYYYLHTFKRIE